MIEQDSDYALLTEIAVAYYDQEQTQEEIAKRFGISRIKVGRLLKKARQEGIVEISVKYHPVFSSQIEQQFISHFGIKRALIALDHHDEDEQRQQVAALVSNYLAGVLKNDMTVTVGQGRNVAAVANHVGVFPERHCRFICGIGGTARAVLKIANQYLEKPESNRLLTVAELDRTAAMLLDRKNTARKLILKNCPDRVHTILPGVIVMTTVTHKLCKEQLYISRYGVREGYLCHKLLNAGT